MNKLDLIGRTAIVTGGAKGIGLAIATRFIHSGANVTIWDIDEDRLKQSIDLLENKGAVKTEVVDVTNKKSIEAATNKVLESENKIDILVNNAGAVGTLAPVWEQPIENWEKMLRLNLTSAFMCCQIIVPSMISKKYGRVVNIASNGGKIGIKNNSGYAAAKAGLISLTKSLSKEVAKTGVLVNCITPGGANTELFDKLSNEYRTTIEEGMELGRLVEPAEIAALAAWLASEECSFSTGAAFDISGGRADY
ncbi:MAG: 3-oxoacyl-ACP reductase [Alphaproteobacteria bacterium]|jgi:NAD(P)-dependent dehydrogenase (short-subunit alcohol dehydrogenase family)|nr:3-oxoacyl-ACP reductase [Alphaproteobacteria bacterium]PPR13633.1 MAG: 3-oxoacyl-[acyl-carrier-protein] reductase FabG [Alphaproteobacteria bacterium MarineAlpha12_Bin1]|tara:strand:- start:3854 stop:4606 length:753 start_codon:yes stop_codon:yes gene_type:complete